VKIYQQHSGNFRAALKIGVEKLITKFNFAYVKFKENEAGIN
jgi:hypothetical protein